MFAFEVVVFIFSLLIQHYSAPWAPIFHATGHEALLWMITNKHSKNQEDTTHKTVCTCHLNTLSSCLNKWLQQHTHALMKNQYCAFERMDSGMLVSIVTGK